MSQVFSITVGEWIAVSWGGSTKQPSGGSFRLSLICTPKPIAAFPEIKQFRQKIAKQILERYDHRQLTELDFVPEAFLRQVINDFAVEVANDGYALQAVVLADHGEWSAQMAVNSEQLR